MGNKSISQLTASASDLASANLIPVVQTAGIGPVKMTGLQLAGGLLGSDVFNGSTVTTSQPVLNLSQTWNAGAVTFTGLLFNASDASSASGSLLLDLQLGSVSKFNVNKSGNGTFTGSLSAGAITGSTYNNITITAPATGSTLTIVDGKTLTINNTLSFSGTDTSNVAFGGGGTVAYTSAVQTLNDKRINPRVVTISDDSFITVNSDITDIAYQNNTQSAGSLTINAPTGTPVDGQKFIIKIRSTNVQTFSWDAIFLGGASLALPAQTTGSNKVDYFGFIYDYNVSKWDIIASVTGY